MSETVGFSAWATAKDDTQLGDFCLHDLRHAAASFWVSNGLDIYTVGRLLGHRSTASSQRYSHIANDTLLAARGMADCVSYCVVELPEAAAASANKAAVPKVVLGS